MADDDAINRTSDRMGNETSRGDPSGVAHEDDRQVLYTYLKIHSEKQTPYKLLSFSDRSLPRYILLLYFISVNERLLNMMLQSDRELGQLLTSIR